MQTLSAQQQQNIQTAPDGQFARQTSTPETQFTRQTSTPDGQFSRQTSTPDTYDSVDLFAESLDVLNMSTILSQEESNLTSTPSTSFQSQPIAITIPPPQSAVPSTSRPPTIRSNKRKRDNSSIDNETSALLAQCRTLVNAPIAPPQMKDQAACFGDWIATKLRALDPRMLSTAEMRLSQVLCQIENEQNNIVVLKPGQMVVENVIIADNTEIHVDTVSEPPQNSNEETDTMINTMTDSQEGAEGAEQLDGSENLDVTFEYNGPLKPHKRKKRTNSKYD